MASTEGTKVSSEGVKVHLKEYKKQIDFLAALAKFPGVLDADGGGARVP